MGRNIYMNRKFSNIFIKQIDNARKMAKNKSKKEILLNLEKISDDANNDNLRNLQKAFSLAMTLAYAFGIATNNRYFPECLEETYMNAYGSSDDVSPGNFSITNKDMINDAQEVIGKIRFIKNIPRNDFYFTLFVNYKGHTSLNLARPLTKSDIYSSIHHALISVYRDKLF